MKPLFYLHSPFQVQLSFDQIIQNLEQVARGGDFQKAEEARQLLNEVAPYSELREGVTDSAQIEKHAGLIQRLLADYFPPGLTHNEIKAISIPYRGFIFNHTERFKLILDAAGPDFSISIRDFDEHQTYVLSCCIILNEYYGTQLDFTKPLFTDIPTAQGIMKHYRVLYNADFMDIIPTERALKLSQADIDLLIDNYDNLELWKEKFPKDSWILKGFTIMTLYDATVENAVSTLKEKLLTSRVEDFHQSVETIFRSIYRSPNIRVGFTLFNREEGTFSIAPFGEPMRSFLLEGENTAGEDLLCAGSYHTIVDKQEYFAVSDTQTFYSQNPSSKLAVQFLNQNIQSFILTPVIKNGNLLGIFEVVSDVSKELNSVNAHKLEIVLPFLTETADRLMTEFQNRVQAIIQTNYTTIHPSVYWKFRNEAQCYIRSFYQAKTYNLKTVSFEDVHPLYGQIDIKGSSEARNSSIQKDLTAQVKALSGLLNNITLQNDELAYTDEQHKLEEIIKLLEYPIQANTEQYINDYIEVYLHPRLKKMDAPEVKDYFLNTDKQDGHFYYYRRKYETTVSQINGCFAKIMDERQAAAQLIFPHYFERFKTDGVEHNMYIGASIAPNKPFDLSKLHQIRLWQLQALIEMELAHTQSKSALPYPLDVTTLILVYHTTISICFRMDEKRFDIDGTYNARYEVVKKRIDKAHIKGTHERITQPGKITIVYSGLAEQLEYEQYIAQLQTQKLLAQKVEKFEIEDLQGVSGLKALRVKIAH